MKVFVFLIMLASCCSAQADCSTTIRVQGFMAIKQCTTASDHCVRADEALHKYMNAVPDEGPATLSIATHGSPWHLYDGEYHILEIDDVAAMVRQQGNHIKGVDLIASWSGTSPDARTKSVAQKLSTALGGMPVKGQDGFVWVSPKGVLHTTRQAFTGRLSGPYWAGKNDDVMASLVSGWIIDLEGEFTKSRDAAGLLQVGAAKEIFLLCPGGALKSYEESAALNNPVAAFNAAILRLERNKPGDTTVAMELLKQSAAQGDKKAQSKLSPWHRQTRPVEISARAMQFANAETNTTQDDHAPGDPLAHHLPILRRREFTPDMTTNWSSGSCQI